MAVLCSQLNSLTFKIFYDNEKNNSPCSKLGNGIALFAFTNFKNGSIKGSVSPSASATSAYVVSGMDTARTNIRNGGFEIGEVKPGTYKLVIEAIAPYKNFEKAGLVVDEKKATDVGEITLQQ